MGIGLLAPNSHLTFKDNVTERRSYRRSDTTTTSTLLSSSPMPSNIYDCLLGWNMQCIPEGVINFEWFPYIQSGFTGHVSCFGTHKISNFSMWLILKKKTIKNTVRPCLMLIIETWNLWNLKSSFSALFSWAALSF